MHTNKLAQMKEFAEQETSKLFAKYAEFLQGWSVSFHRSVKKYGTCNYQKKTISYSLQFLAEMEQETILKTVYHEVAHALTPGEKHNETWRRVCIMLGGTGEKYSKEYLKTVSYKLECSHCGVIGQTPRRIKIRTQKREKMCRSCARIYRTHTLSLVDCETNAVVETREIKPQFL